MAQNFRRYTSNDVGTSAATLFTADSYDTVVGISVANVTTSAVVASVYINDGSNDIYLVKDAPIPARFIITSFRWWSKICCSIW